MNYEQYFLSKISFIQKKIWLWFKFNLNCRKLNVFIIKFVDRRRLTTVQNLLRRFSWMFYPIGNPKPRFSSLHPYLRRLHRKRHACCPARLSWLWWWKIEIHWCRVRRSPSTSHLDRCVLRWSFRLRIYYRRWIFLRCRCGSWNRHLGTWSWGWRGGRWSLCNRNLFRRCTALGSSRLFLALRRYATENEIISK